MSNYYCSCGHPWGYHHPTRGCTMPVDALGLPVMRTEDTVKSCGCKNNKSRCYCDAYDVSPEHCLTLFDSSDEAVERHAVGGCWKKYQSATEEA